MSILLNDMAEEKFTKVLNPYVAEAKIAPVSGRPIDFAPKYAAPAFVAVSFSAWLYVDASYRGPAWRRWVFKPVTLILLLLLAWQAPMFNA
ncbi:hypothetical protein ACG0T9_19935, partial [Klebsiella pneumoniae]